MQTFFSCRTDLPLPISTHKLEDILKSAVHVYVIITSTPSSESTVHSSIPAILAVRQLNIISNPASSARGAVAGCGQAMLQSSWKLFGGPAHFYLFHRDWSCHGMNENNIFGKWRKKRNGQRECFSSQHILSTAFFFFFVFSIGSGCKLWGWEHVLLCLKTWYTQTHLPFVGSLPFVTFALGQSACLSSVASCRFCHSTRLDIIRFCAFLDCCYCLWYTSIDWWLLSERLLWFLCMVWRCCETVVCFWTCFSTKYQCSMFWRVIVQYLLCKLLWENFVCVFSCGVCFKRKHFSIFKMKNNILAKLSIMKL